MKKLKDVENSMINILEDGTVGVACRSVVEFDLMQHKIIAHKSTKVISDSADVQTLLKNISEFERKHLEHKHKKESIYFTYSPEMIEAVSSLHEILIQFKHLESQHKIDSDFKKRVQNLYDWAKERVPKISNLDFELEEKYSTQYGRAYLLAAFQDAVRPLYELKMWEGGLDADMGITAADSIIKSEHQPVDIEIVTQLGVAKAWLKHSNKTEKLKEAEQQEKRQNKWLDAEANRLYPQKERKSLSLRSRKARRHSFDVKKRPPAVSRSEGQRKPKSVFGSRPTLAVPKFGRSKRRHSLDPSIQKKTVDFIRSLEEKLHKKKEKADAKEKRQIEKEAKRKAGTAELLAKFRRAQVKSEASNSSRSIGIREYRDRYKAKTSKGEV